MAYSDKVIDHYENPRNVGKFDDDDDSVGTGMVGAPACGDVMRLQIKVNEEGVIEESIWANWRRGLLSCMTLPVFRDAYGNLKVEMSYPEFHAWLSQALAEAEVENQVDGGQVRDHAEQ